MRPRSPALGSKEIAVSLCKSSAKRRRGSKYAALHRSRPLAGEKKREEEVTTAPPGTPPILRRRGDLQASTTKE